jgi:alcohol dehydrogenase class IV
MTFEFATAARIVFGPGVLKEISSAVKALGPHVLLVTGHDTARAEPLEILLLKAGLEITRFTVAGEPTVEIVRQGSRHARQLKCDLVVAMGGGSAMDAGKAIAALAANSGDLMDYLEVVGRGQSLTKASLPLITIPTTAGTGAEVSRNAVISVPEHGVKASLRSPLMLARLALVDPELTLSLPPQITAVTGLDALTQLIESFVSHRANPLTDSFCREGLVRIVRSLKAAVEHGRNLAARTDMALGSLLSGLALANAGLGAVHGFAGPIGGLIDAPHGGVCAALLPHVMAVNWRALLRRDSHHPACQRYEELGRILTGKATASAENGISWIQELCGTLKISSLATYGLTPGHIETVVIKAAAASSMKGNPIALTRDEMAEILFKAI